MYRALCFGILTVGLIAGSSAHAQHYCAASANSPHEVCSREHYVFRCSNAHEYERVRMCRAALQYAPDDQTLRRQLAQSLLDIGDAAGAAAELARVAAGLPRSAGAWLEYATALVDAYRFDDAAVAIGRSLALDPNDFMANKIAVIAYERSGRLEATFDANVRLAAAGDPIAMNDIAEALLYGRGVAENASDAVTWFERAASAGHYGAMDRLAHVHRMGLYGREANTMLAEQWSKRAAAD